MFLLTAFVLYVYSIDIIVAKLISSTDVCSYYICSLCLISGKITVAIVQSGLLLLKCKSRKEGGEVQKTRDRHFYISHDLYNHHRLIISTERKAMG